METTVRDESDEDDVGVWFEKSVLEWLKVGDSTDVKDEVDG